MWCRIYQKRLLRRSRSTKRRMRRDHTFCPRLALKISHFRIEPLDNLLELFLLVRSLATRYNREVRTLKRLSLLNRAHILSILYERELFGARFQSRKKYGEVRKRKSIDLRLNLMFLYRGENQVFSAFNTDSDIKFLKSSSLRCLKDRVGLDLYFIINGLNKRFWSWFNFKSSNILEGDFTVLCLFLATPSKVYDVVVNKLGINHLELGWTLKCQLAVLVEDLGMDARLTRSNFDLECILYLAHILTPNKEFVVPKHKFDPFKILDRRKSWRLAGFRLSLRDGTKRDSSIK